MTAATSRRSARDGRFLLDHRGDDEDVVRRQVLRPRVGEIHAGEALAEGGQLVCDELAGGRLLRELVPGREEKPLERPALHVFAKAWRGYGTLNRTEVAGPREPRRDLALGDRDLTDCADSVGHLADVEPLGEDDPQPLQGLRGRRLDGSGLAPAAAGEPREEPRARRRPPRRPPQPPASRRALQEPLQEVGGGKRHPPASCHPSAARASS